MRLTSVVHILGGAHIHEGIPKLRGNWAPGKPTISLGCPEFYDTTGRHRRIDLMIITKTEISINYMHAVAQSQERATSAPEYQSVRD